MELLFDSLLALLTALWWPFCRSMALLSAAPAIGEATLPVPLRLLLSLVLAVILLPLSAQAAAIDPFSLQGVWATLEQAAIGGALGLALHFTTSAILLLGTLLSSQISLSMAVMNDPLNGSSSDVVSSLLSVLCMTVFFCIDGHLVLVGVLGGSLQAWPVGSGVSALGLQSLAYNVTWVFSAALLLALPMVFSTCVVQIGFGFLNRAAPSLNLFSLGFSLVTLFGLLMLSALVRFVPEHYVRMTSQVLDMLRRQMEGA